MENAGRVSDGARVADGAADEREEIVIAEGAFESDVEVTEEADEEGLHEGDAERVGAEEDAAAEVVPGVEDGVDGADGQKGVEEDQTIDGSALDVDEDAADEEAEPADLDGDGFGGQLPAGGRGLGARAAGGVAHA